MIKHPKKQKIATSSMSMYVQHVHVSIRCRHCVRACVRARAWVCSCVLECERAIALQYVVYYVHVPPKMGALFHSSSSNRDFTVPVYENPRAAYLIWFNPGPDQLSPPARLETQWVSSKTIDCTHVPLLLSIRLPMNEAG